MRVALLNPPFPRLVIKDQYCALSSKMSYYWPHIDLVTTAGYLVPEHELLFVDAIRDRLPAEEAFERLRGFGVQAVLALSSGITWEEDRLFLRRCKQELGSINVACGDVFYSDPERFAGAGELDAVSLDFPAYGLSGFLRSGEPQEGLLVRKSGRAVRQEYAVDREFHYPVPPHELFLSRRYFHPFIRRYPWAVTMGSRGCPFRCAYCPVQRVSYFERSLANLFEELDRLRSLGVRGLWFRDLTFSANPRRAREICREMIRRDYRFSWICEDRFDLLDEEALELMARAGCHHIAFGLESVNLGALRAQGRGGSAAKLDQLRALCARSRKLGIQTLLYLIFGLPGETIEDIRRSIDFVCATDADHVSVNHYSYRPGSKATQTHVAGEGRIDSSAGDSELDSLKSELFRRFYSDPRRILSILRNFRNPWQARHFIRNGISFLAGS